MCLTQDGLALSHFEQARQLIAVGARWIQVRMKAATDVERYAAACAIASLCRKHEAICIVNDRVDIALTADADGVHLGRTDGNWRDVRARLRPGMILGGTVNTDDDAVRALEADCLDYVGVGPWRFTRTKERLAPVLGRAGVAALIARLDGIPAWAIGGIGRDDLPDVRATGAAGAAMSSAFHREGTVAENFNDLSEAWRHALEL